MRIINLVIIFFVKCVSQYFLSILHGKLGVPGAVVLSGYFD